MKCFSACSRFASFIFSTAGLSAVSGLFSGALFSEEEQAAKTSANNGTRATVIFILIFWNISKDRWNYKAHPSVSSPTPPDRSAGWRTTVRGSMRSVARPNDLVRRGRMCLLCLPRVFHGVFSVVKALPRRSQRRHREHGEKLSAAYRLLRLKGERILLFTAFNGKLISRHR